MESAHVTYVEDALADDHSRWEGADHEDQADEADNQRLGVEQHPEETEDDGAEHPRHVLEDDLVEDEVIERL